MVRVASLKAEMPQDAQPYVVIYDADCGVCTAAIQWLQRQHLREPVSWLPLDFEEAQRLVPNRPADEMAVVGPTGQVWTGVDGAIVSLALAGHSIMAGLLRLPLVHALAKLGYRLTARNRVRISRLFGWNACRL
jgi:predicted DCC family thiol-disulfide oxidoreductase YuxK